MADYRSVNRLISHGDRLELGELKRADVEGRGADVRLFAVTEDDPEEYVALAVDLADGEAVDVHPEASVLGIARRGQNAASLWALLPAEVYADGS